MRSWSSSRSLAGLAVVGAIVIVAARGSDAQGRAPLFSAAPAARVLPAAVDRAQARRLRHLRVNAAAFDTLLRPATGDRPALLLNLFADVQLAIVRERLEHGRQGHTSWVGHVDGDPTSTIALTWDGHTLSGGIVTGGVAFEVTPAGDGLAVVAEREAGAAPVELSSPDAPGGVTTDAAAQALAADGSTAAIDLLVLYTSAAGTRVGGTGEIQSQLANAVAVTNTAFQRSGVNAVLTAVGIEEVAYTEGTGLSADLYAIGVGGAANPAVEALRAASGADLVALVTGRPTTSGGCGVAWLGPSSEYGFSVTEQACLYAGQWTFTHELGHNFGAHHAPGDSSDTTPTCPTYACAYRDGAIRTLMAYYASGSATSRTLNFSSALVREPAGVGVATGNSLQDNARKLSETVASVAAFRSPPTVTQAPGVPRQFAAGVTAAGVTLSWLPPASGGGVTSYELEAGSTPGSGNLVRTAVAASPLAVAAVPVGTYYARLRSVGPGGRSAPTADVVIVVAPCAAPGAVTLSASRVGGVVSLAWTTPSGTAPFTYTIGAGRSRGVADVGIFPMGAATALAVAPPPGVYYVKAVAANTCGMGPISNEVVVTVP